MNKYKVDINKEYSLLIKQAELPSVVSIEGLSQPVTEVALYILESGGYRERDGITVAESGYDLSIAGEVFVKPAAGYLKIIADKEYRLGVGLLPTTVGSANQDSFVQEIIETVMKTILPDLNEKVTATEVSEIVEDRVGDELASKLAKEEFTEVIGDTSSLKETRVLRQTHGSWSAKGVFTSGQELPSKGDEFILEMLPDYHTVTRPPFPMSFSIETSTRGGYNTKTYQLMKEDGSMMLVTDLAKESIKNVKIVDTGETVPRDPESPGALMHIGRVTELHASNNISSSKTIVRQLESLEEQVFQSGVEINALAVEALNSKGVQASIDNSIKENINKINDINVGDYSIGDTCKRAVEVWSESEPEEIWTFNGNSRPVTSVAVDDNGNVYSGSNDKTVKKISPSGSEIWTFSGYTSYVTSVAVSNNGDVYSGSSNKTVKKISPSGSEMWTFRGHGDAVNSVAVDSNGNVYSGSSDKTVKKISPDGEEIWTFSGHTNYIMSVAVDSNGNVYSGSGDETVKKISPDGEEIWTFSGHSGSVNSVTVDNNGNVYSGSSDKTVKKISPSGSEIWTFSGHTGRANSVAVDNNGNVYSGSYDKTVKKISPSGEEIWTFSGHSQWVNSVAVDSNGNVYSGSDDETVRKLFAGIPKLLGYKILE